MKVLIIHKVHNSLQDLLVIKGFEVDTKLDLTRDDILNILSNYDGLIVRSALKVDKEVVDAGINLKFIGRLGAGLENIDVEYAIQKGIDVVNAAEGNRSAVGEHAVAMLLNLNNKINIADAEVRKGLWQREANRGEEIEGKTVGIIGYGNMGSAFAERLSGFGVNVIAYDKYKTNYGNRFVKEVSLDVLKKEADIVSLHVPLKDDTYYMIDRNFIDSLSKPVTIINTSRGHVVKTVDLVEGIKGGKVKGACIDVIEYEGLSFESINSDNITNDFRYLLESNRVVLTPHIAGWTHQSNEKMARVLAQKIIEIKKRF